MYADELLIPWFEALRADVPALEVFDAHTHVGSHDPSGFSASVADLTHSLDSATAGRWSSHSRNPTATASRTGAASRRPPPAPVD